MAAIVLARTSGYTSPDWSGQINASINLGHEDKLLNIDVPMTCCFAAP